MPTRLLREGILASDRVDRLDEPEEVFYRRLMSKVDDHGLYDARPSILRAALYPLRLHRVKEHHITRWLAGCAKAELIALYEVDGKPYLQMLDTRWKVRTEPKYPLRTPENTCKQLQTPVSLDVDVVRSRLIEVVGTTTPARSANAPHADASPLNGHKGLNGTAQALAETSPIVIVIPLIGEEEFGVTEAMVAQLADLYPAVDVPQTLREIKGWNLSHPMRRKTLRGVLGHINAWLAKEQNKG